MGQKVHPNGFRLGITKDFNAVWYAEGEQFTKNLKSDIELREMVMKRLKQASISKICIERPAKSVRLIIHTARPGIVIGKKGEDVDKLRAEITKLTGQQAQINIVEIRKPELDAKLVAENMAQQLEKRMMFRRVMKRAVQSAMKQGAKGIKVAVSGRLGGAEIARTEWYREGRVPLHTLRADIDYATAEALTVYGIIGVKVWIFKDEIMNLKSWAQNKDKESNKKDSYKSKNKKG